MYFVSCILYLLPTCPNSPKLQEVEVWRRGGRVEREVAGLHLMEYTEFQVG